MIAAVVGDKRQLRAGIRAARTGRVDGAEVAGRLLEAARAAGLLDPDGRPGVVGPVVLSAYVAMPGEPDVSDIRAAVRAASGTVLLPIPAAGRVLAWAPDDGRYARAERFGVPIPAGPPVGAGAACLVEQGTGLVLVPALAVDRSGTRLGQGGGYYDRLLAELPPGIGVLAVVHDEELLAVGSLPREAHDAVVPGALTPAGVVQLGS